ncbi:ubiquinone biosynthesis protein COQ4 homolog, mitochondrial-like [Amphiura filiformis]|uniref:ubiquinone biosynthesis protein COQ4 homolog, mitochondrial-like n=1 Tax=Amphiura filiformis TaxID=82378 RepID=UPI003B21A25C
MFLATMSGFILKPSTMRQLCFQCIAARHCIGNTRSPAQQNVISHRRLCSSTKSDAENQTKHDTETAESLLFNANAFDIKDPQEFTDSEDSSEEEILYKDHIPTTLFQKSLLAVGSACMSLYDPYRADMIATLGETTGPFALRNIQQKMLADPEGRQILQEQPRINSSTVDMKYLAELPKGTFGREYIDFMTRNNITADSRTNVQFVDDPKLGYVMQRYREVHDLHHTLLGMPTTMLGEIAVKWFEMIQTGLPMCALGAVFGPLRLRSASKYEKLVRMYLPWAIRNATSARFLLNVYYEKRWEQSYEELRQELGLITFDEKKTYI